MKGSIRRRSKNSWEISIDLGRNLDGSRRRKYLNVKGKKSQAAKKLRELLTTADKGLPLELSRETLGAYLLHWHENYAVPNTRPRTADRYMTDIKNHLTPLLGNIPLSKLTADNIQAAEAKMLAKGLSARSVLHAHRVLAQSLKHAVEKGHIWRNPCDVVKAPKISRPIMKVPSPETVVNILEKARTHLHYPAFHLLAFTGARRGEVCGLQWGDIDLDQKRISINRSAVRVKGKGVMMFPPKTESGRRNIAIDSQTVDVLRTLQGTQLVTKLDHDIPNSSTDHVLSDELGNPLDPYVLTNSWRRLVSRLGLTGIRLHDLRHFHASLLLRMNTHPKIVQERLGHSTISITLDTYSHSIPSLQREAADSFADQMKQVDMSANHK